uniref:Uncharacterized protein n=1 Tax=Anopheles dirus TaxID=7168 RepID=A0A182NW85_9DIPT
MCWPVAFTLMEYCHCGRSVEIASRVLYTRCFIFDSQEHAQQLKTHLVSSVTEVLYRL